MHYGTVMDNEWNITCLHSIDYKDASVTAVAVMKLLSVGP